MRDPWKVAAWRFEQISPLLDSQLNRAERRQYVREKSKEPIEWPHSGKGRAPLRPIGRSTQLRWLKLYRKEGLRGLLPKRRNVKPNPDRSEPIAYALALLVEEPERSLTQLLRYIKLEFPDSKLSRSTLDRELKKHRAFAGIVKHRSGKVRKLRDRYETDKPHACWQLDGKRFFVQFADGSRRRVHVLSVLDDFSRYVLATIVALAENIAAAVRVVRLAISKWGLSNRMQCDRGSAFDSIDFRTGLALLGVHRNWVRSKAPEAQGKVEAYHRVLKRWFVRELRHQEVQNLEHLEALLQATIDLFYNQHYHREIKMSPETALAARLSPRRVSAEDLARAFWASAEAKSHPKTGELSLPNGMFRVPARYAGRRLKFRYDPVEADRAVLLIDRDRELALEPFRKKNPFPPAQDTEPPRGTGQLQKLLDVWRGASRPNAQPGFGLPELFRELSHLLGHLPPQDESEAQTILGFYRRFGPLHPDHFRDALAKTQVALGPGRALETYLDHLARLIAAHAPPENQS